MSDEENKDPKDTTEDKIEETEVKEEKVVSSPDKELMALLKDAGLSEADAQSAVIKAQKFGAKTAEDAKMLRVNDWLGCGVMLVQARKLVMTLGEKSKQPTAGQAAAAKPGASMNILPHLPDDDALLAALQVGGISKVGETDVIAGVRGYVASLYGVMELDRVIRDKVGERAESLDEPWPDEFYEMDKQVARREHADVLRAMGVSASVVSQARCNEFLARMRIFWGELRDFHQQAVAWMESYRTTMTDPTLMLQMMGAMAGGGGAVAPGLMTQAPDTAPVVDLASAVIDKLNRVYAGPGIPVARSLAADAIGYKKIIESPALRGLVGAASQEEMLKMLGAAVGADAVRTESAAARYVISVMKMAQVTEDQLPFYIVALVNLGNTIPWERLQEGAQVGGRRRSSAAVREPGRY